MKTISRNTLAHIPLLTLIVAMGLFVFNSCGTKEKAEKEHNEATEHLEESEVLRGEHQREGGERREGEEDGKQLAIYEQYNVTKHGIQIELAYDRPSNSFVGFMKNVSDKTIEKARVEIHLSNGIELGPTKPVILEPGMNLDLKIKATEEDFTGWIAHAEVGDMEHSGDHK